MTIAKAPALLLRIEEAADLLSIGRSTIYDLLNRGELPSVRIGGAGKRGAVRIARTDLEDWVSRQRKANTLSHNLCSEE